MAKFSKWHVGGIVAVGVAMMGAALFAKQTFSPSVYGVCTVGFNYRETAIYRFGVATGEGVCGNSAFGKQPGEVYSGGGVACGCSVRPGEQATVKWEFGESYEEVKRGVPLEKHQTTVTIPQPETGTARYLQVHFLADNRVVLDWRDDTFSRVDPVSGKILDIHGGRIDPETGKFTPFRTEN